MRDNIILIGFMGCGKTSIGKVLAEKVNYSFFDTDEQIEKKYGITIKQTFSIYGEDYFRELESRIINSVSSLEKTIISTGGGSVIRPENRKVLKNNGIVIWLSASLDTIMKNISNDNERPLLENSNIEKTINRLLRQRKEYYKECDYKISVDSLTIQQAADTIIEILKENNAI